jgi:putative NIF3 family GTP cyclohydrolase 1 type 2
MKVKDILEHFLSRMDWVERDKTVDRVIVGDPEADVDRCLVTWMATFDVLRQMVAGNIRLLVCHEPTFWNHWDRRETNDPWLQEKLAYIQQHELVILRNHDCWDRFPQVGIPWAWAQFLGLEGQPVGTGDKGYLHRYDIRPVTLDAFAQRVAERCAELGEPLVQVTGVGTQMVSRIGIGTGCLCNIRHFHDMGCDCSVVCDDGTIYWADIQRAQDFNHAVIRVNHGTSEEPGMIALAKYINEHIEGVQAEYAPHGCSFRLVGK